MSDVTTELAMEASDKALEIARLKADNNMLRERITTQKQTIQAYRDESREWRGELELLRDGYGSMSREHSQTIVELSDAYHSIDQLKFDNAKLRELVRDLYEMAYPECPSAFEAAFADRMRELGVDE